MIWQTNIEEEFEEEEILECVQAYKSMKSLLSNSYVFCYNVYSTFFFYLTTQIKQKKKEEVEINNLFSSLYQL